MDGLKKYIGVWLVLTIVLLTSITSLFNEGTEKNKLTVSAASSMSASLMEIQSIFEEKNSTVDLQFNFGGTGSLRRQFEQGAPVDLFIAASEKHFQALNDQDLFHETSPLLSNRLVMIENTHLSANDSLDAFIASEGLLAIGTPDAVPAGTYAKQALISIGAWNDLEEAGRLVFAKDARHIVQLVEQGMVQAGIVYQSDTHTVSDQIAAYSIASELHNPIHYFIGRPNQSITTESNDFYEFLLSEEALEIFQQYGFETKEQSRKVR